ncbi:uncharacterized protein LOC134263185 [Saccostrea cucullata]|uniref:uncharacterized protein LOC134263185 n=1 Tax=Saccostrea cuccullata TaxID=36930 RepID=UPI002ED3FBEC
MDHFVVPMITHSYTLTDHSYFAHVNQTLPSKTSTSTTTTPSSTTRAPTSTTRMPTSTRTTPTSTTTMLTSTTRAPTSTTTTPTSTTRAPTSTTTTPTSTTRAPTSTTTTPTSTTRAPTSTTTTPTSTTSTPTSCYLCDGIPTFLCERLSTPLTCNSADQQFCINKLVNNRDGSRTLDRRCATEQECRHEWWEKTSDRQQCVGYDQNSFTTTHFECSFCCTTPKCNKNIVPDDLFVPPRI